MKNLIQASFRAFILISFFAFANDAFAQQICSSPAVGCDNTNLSNYGYNSDNNPATIEYDNMVSGFHATIVRNADGTYSVWGQNAHPTNNGGNGTTGATNRNVLSPLEINSTNFPGLKGEVLKFSMGSEWGSATALHQFIILTTHGLFVWGTQGKLLHTDATSSSSFQRLVGVASGTGGIIGADTTGLPSGVAPGDVRMMFATYRTLAITTCGGDVYVLSQNARNRGNGNTSSNTTNSRTWARVTKRSDNNPLTGIVACRGTRNTLFALDASGNLWTWGSSVYKGNGNNRGDSTRAIQMSLPVAGFSTKMIGCTNDGGNPSYYALSTTGGLYALGVNNNRQLGDFSTSERRSWVQCEYTNNSSYMNDIVWFSPNEHDYIYNNTSAAVNALNSSKMVWAWGGNGGRMIGRGASTSVSPAIPDGINNTPVGSPSARDSFLTVETGGHTSMVVKQCHPNFGYVGHRIDGSMGHGSNNAATENNYQFNTAPVQICGVPSTPDANMIPKVNFSGTGNCYETEYVLRSLDPNAIFAVLSSTPANIAEIEDDTMLVFSAPGEVRVTATTKTVCGDLIDTSTFTVQKCKFTNPDVNIGTVNKQISGNIATNDNISYSATPYGTSPTLIESPGGSTPSLSLQSNGNYTFQANMAGTYRYAVTVCNPGQSSGCPTEFLSITVKDNNTLSNNPLPATDIAVTMQGVSVTVNTLDNDFAGATGRTLVPSSVSIVTPPNAGTQGSITNINTTTGQITFTPIATFKGEVSYFYQVCDDASQCATAMQRIFVNGTGTQNTTLAADDFHTKGKNTTITGNLRANDKDPEGNTQTVTAKNETVAGVGVFNLLANGDYTFTPAKGFHGQASFTYQVCDNGTPQACAIATLYILVDNEYPQPDFNATFTGVSVAGNLSTNDNLPTGYTYGNLQAVSGNPSGAVPSLGSDGAYSFSATDTGTYRFSVDVCTPGNNFCFTELLTITVSDPVAVTNKPTTIPDLAIMTGASSNTATITINVLANDRIANIFGGFGTLGNPSVVGGSNKNSATIDVVNGKITYRPANNFFGNDTFSYRVCEQPGDTLCTEEKVIVTVNAPGTPSDILATDDYVFTFTNTPITILADSGLLVNDFSTQAGSMVSVVGSSVSVRRASDIIVTGGSITLEDDGSYTFTPDNSFVGTAVVPYKSCIGSLCAAATLYIQVYNLQLLPISLIKFVPVPYANHVDVQWTTAGELNNHYFTIERSYNLQNWDLVGKVDGAGTSYNKINYTLTDYTKPTGVVYYRISQTDFDGTTQELRIAKIETDIQQNQFILYPNPCRESLNIKGFFSSSARFEIYNSLGQLVLNGTGEMGENLTIDVATLPHGTYFIRVYDKEEMKIKMVFLKEE